MFQLHRLPRAHFTRFGAAAAIVVATAWVYPVPVSAAPAPPVLAFPAEQVTTGSTDIAIHGTAPVGASVVIFVDSDLDGHFHSVLDYSWYRTVRSDGTFEVPIFLQRTGTANRDLYAFTDTGSEQSAFAKVPTIVHQLGAPFATMQAAVPAAAPAPAPVVDGGPPAAEPALTLDPQPVMAPELADAAPVEATVFQVGDAVEFRRFVGDEWTPGTILEVQYGPVYIVQYMNEALARPLDTLVFPLNVRAPEGVAAPQVLLPGGELALGTYVCTYDTWTAPPPFGRLQSQQMGSFTLLGDGTYSWLDNGEGGEYAYDPATGSISWLSGWFAGGAPESTIFRRNSADNAQIDIRWTGVYDWSCGANL